MLNRKGPMPVPSIKKPGINPIIVNTSEITTAHFLPLKIPIASTSLKIIQGIRKRSPIEPNIPIMAPISPALNPSKLRIKVSITANTARENPAILNQPSRVPSRGRLHIILLSGLFCCTGLTVSHAHNIPVKHIHVVITNQFQLIKNFLNRSLLLNLFSHKTLKPILSSILFFLNT